MEKDKLASWAVSNGLVLISEAKAWLRSAEEPFRRAAVREQVAIDETAWLDFVADLGLSTPVITIGDTPRIPSSARTPENIIFQDGHDVLILHDDPVIVLGLVDPFAEAMIVSAAAAQFPKNEVRCVLISPHAFAKISALRECALAEPPEPIMTLPRPWSSTLGAGYSYPKLADIVFALWDSRYPVLSIDQIGTRLKPFETTKEAIAFGRSHRRIWIVTSVPTRSDIAEAVLQETGKQVVVCGCTPETFFELQEEVAALVDTSSSGQTSSGPLNVNSWGSNDAQGSLWHRILERAIAMKASDIHIEPMEGQARVRFRIGGVMRTQAPLENAQFGDVLRTFKLDGDMLPDETRRPQDGGNNYTFRGVRYDQRYSTMPTNSGKETAVCRIFNNGVLSLDKLGLSYHELHALKWALRRELGMVIITGPTGSGKTTTLYALLSELNTPERKLFTVEEPVEKHFADAVQIGVKPAIDWTWDGALRHILRQDPDVMLIGELRDVESARVAVQAALTGHKVLTTTHANDAAGAMLRLTGSFGIDPVALKNCLTLSIAQRLVPRLCIYCRELRTPTSNDFGDFPQVNAGVNPLIGEPRGCPSCRGTGFLGQHLVAEFLPVDRAVSSMIVHGMDLDRIRKYNGSRGYRSLIHRATALMLTGEISVSDASSFLEDLPL